MTGEYEGEIGAPFVQQASPVRRKRGRPRKTQLVEANVLSDTPVTTQPTTSMVPTFVSCKSKTPPRPNPPLSNSESPRVRAPSAPAFTHPLRESDGLHELEEDEEEEEEVEEMEEHQDKEGEGEQPGSVPVIEDSVPRLPSQNLVPSGEQAGSVESTVREELSGPARKRRNAAAKPSPKPKRNVGRPGKRSKKNGDASMNPKNRSATVSTTTRSIDYGPGRPAEMTQSSRGSTPSTARLVRTVRAKKKQLMARPSFFVDASKPQVPSYSDNDEIYTEDEEEEEEGEEEEEEEKEQDVAEQSVSNPKSLELEAWAMDESVQDWIS